VAQFDVYKNPNRTTQKTVPYLLDVQNSLFEGLSTRLIVPLVRLKQSDHPIKRLNPVFEIEGKPVYMSTAEMAGISRKSIGKHVVSLSSRRDEIRDSLDFLITGF